MKNGWHNIQHYLLRGTFYAIGRLPQWILYGVLARFICFVLYQLLRYRRNVVFDNLKNAFPEKSKAERKEIERNFYRHLSDVFIDTVALCSMTSKEVEKRIKFPNIAQHEALMEGKNWIAAMAHYGSWELMMSYAMHSDHHLLAVYRPLHNRAFDWYYRHIRARFGAYPVAMNDILRRTVQAHRPGETPIVIGLICDQTPPRIEIKQWFPFLNQETPFFSGMEKMGLKFGMPVYFVHVSRSAPHRYEITFEEIYNGKEPLAEHEMTQRYIALLEEMIRRKPELWMWSHRRWKYKKPTRNG